jgi:type IV pilus assembly protein PilQ
MKMKNAGRNYPVRKFRSLKAVAVVLIAAFVFPLFSAASKEDDPRFAALEEKLAKLSVEVPGLNNKVELSVNGVSLQEFIRAVAITNNLNVSVEPALDTKIYDNFSDVTVSNVFLFLCRRYDLDIMFIGNIMVFSKYVPPPPVAVPYSPRLPNITWDAQSKRIDLDLKNDSLPVVVRELTRKTGTNVVFDPKLSGKIVNGFILDQPLESALDKLAFANDFKVTKADSNFFMLEEKPNVTNGNQNAKNVSGETKANSLPAGTKISVRDSFISIEATNAPISDLVFSVSSQLKKEYYLYSELKGNATLNIKDATYDQFLDNVLNATEYTYRSRDSVYFIGDRNLEGLRISRLYRLQFRTADKVPDYIPAEMKKGVEIKSFPDLNGIIMSGSEPRILEIERFLALIDQVVPMVMIEVIILDVNKSHTVSAGIQMGLGSPPPSNGTLTPGLDATLNATAINNLISGINGFGFLNLGAVTPDFYVKLHAMEDDGMLNIRSTPQLSTLNGSEAKMSIGRTEYYLERTTNIIGSQNPQTQITNTYKPLNADFSLVITPMVSGDEQVTLNISVTQSTFTKRVTEDGPFGTTQRSFSSIVRVRNQEMILLGGLEEESKNESGKGTPFLSRIPVIKWLFGERTRTKSETHLSVLIKPTVIY